MSRPDVAAWPRLSRREMAERVVRDIPDGSWINLGIGLPTEVAEVPVIDKEIVFHSENGVTGIGPRPLPGQEQPDLINASKNPVSLRPGGAYMSHADSFALIRGGHLDLAVLGAFQVSFAGDLANWSIPGDKVPAVGGAMDLADGAKAIWVVMKLFGQDLAPKLVAECTYPLTAARVVSRVYTDVATFQLGPGDPVVVDLVNGVSMESLSRVLGGDIQPAGGPARPEPGSALNWRAGP